MVGAITPESSDDVQQKLVWSTIHDDLPALLVAVEAEILPE